MKLLLPQRKRTATTLRRLAVQWLALLWMGSLAAPAQEPPPEPETNQPAPAVQEPAGAPETNPPAGAEQRPPMTGGEVMPPPGADAAPPAMGPEDSQPEESAHDPAGRPEVEHPAVAEQRGVASVQTNPVAVSVQKASGGEGANSNAPTAVTNAPTAVEQRLSRRRNNRQAESEQEVTTGTGTNELAFKIIYERNIFNPNRGPRYSRRNEEDAPKPVKVEGFSLVGTLLSEKGAYAFFDGTEARYRAALKTSNTIAGYTLAAITPNFVTLRTPTNTFDLTMNMQMRRQDEGDWELTEAKGSWNSTNSASSTGAVAAASDEGGGNDPSADEVMKRLMKKREEELKK